MDAAALLFSPQPAGGQAFPGRSAPTGRGDAPPGFEEFLQRSGRGRAESAEPAQHPRKPAPNGRAAVHRSEQDDRGEESAETQGGDASTVRQGRAEPEGAIDSSEGATRDRASEPSNSTPSQRAGSQGAAAASSDAAAQSLVVSQSSQSAQRSAQQEEGVAATQPQRQTAAEPQPQPGAPRPAGDAQPDPPPNASTLAQAEAEPAPDDVSAPRRSASQATGRPGPVATGVAVEVGLEDGSGASPRNAAHTPDPGRSAVAAAMQADAARSRTARVDAAESHAAKLDAASSASSSSGAGDSSPSPAGAVQAARSLSQIGDATSQGPTPANATLDAANDPGAARAAREAEVETAFRSSMSRGLDAALRQRGGTLTMRLTPASLGSMRIDLSIDGGAVEARFEATTTEGRQLLARHTEALRASLEARGLSVQRIEVAPPSSLNQDGLTQQQQGQNDGPDAHGERMQAHDDAADGRSRGRSDDSADHDGRTFDGPSARRDHSDDVEDDATLASAGGVLNAVA